MNSCLDAIVLLDVQLWHVIVVVSAGVADISQSRGIDDVAHAKALNRLVFWDSFGRRRAPHTVRVATAVLIAPVVSVFK